MCRNLTPPEKIVPCSRCLQPANPDDGWEHSWPIHGSVTVGFHSCLLDELRGGALHHLPVEAAHHLVEQRALAEQELVAPAEGRARVVNCASGEALLKRSLRKAAMRLSKRSLRSGPQTGLNPTRAQ